MQTLAQPSKMPYKNPLGKSKNNLNLIACLGIDPTLSIEVRIEVQKLESTISKGARRGRPSLVAAMQHAYWHL